MRAGAIALALGLAAAAVATVVYGAQATPQPRRRRAGGVSPGGSGLGDVGRDVAAGAEGLADAVARELRAARVRELAFGALERTRTLGPDYYVVLEAREQVRAYLEQTIEMVAGEAVATVIEERCAGVDDTDEGALRACYDQARADYFRASAAARDAAARAAETGAPTVELSFAEKAALLAFWGDGATEGVCNWVVTAYAVSQGDISRADAGGGGVGGAAKVVGGKMLVGGLSALACKGLVWILDELGLLEPLDAFLSRTGACVKDLFSEDWKDCPVELWEDFKAAVVECASSPGDCTASVFQSFWDHTGGVVGDGVQTVREGATDVVGEVVSWLT